MTLYLSLVKLVENNYFYLEMCSLYSCIFLLVNLISKLRLIFKMLTLKQYSWAVNCFR